MIDGKSHGLGWVSVCMLLCWTWRAYAQQPVAFPHNTHSKMGLDCIDCHIGADTRAAAGIPSVTKCMLCHAKLGREKPEVKKVIDYANRKIEIPWQRVYYFRAVRARQIQACAPLSSRHRLRHLPRRHDESHGRRKRGQSQHGQLPHLPPAEPCFGGLRRMPLLGVCLLNGPPQFLQNRFHGFGRRGHQRMREQDEPAHSPAGFRPRNRAR